MNLRLILLLTLAAFPSACGGGKNSQPPPPAAPITAAKVVKKSMPVQINAIGVVEPSQAVAIASQVGGILQAVHFIEGQEVKAGDLLFTIEPAPFESRVRQAEANLARARAEANNAQTTFQRYEGLVGKEYIAKENYDQAKASALGSQAGVKGAEAALENAKLELGYTAIRAPVSGRVGDLLVKQGNVIKANDPAVPLVRLNQLKPALVRFSVPEQRLSEIREEQSLSPLRVTVHIQGGPAKSVEGNLSFIDNSVDRNTGTILLKAMFPNNDELLWPGQFVDVSLTLRNVHEALVVPIEAVQSGQQGQYVWFIKPDQTVDLRKVAVAFSVGSESVIGSGLQAGEEVVTDGQLRLAPGARIERKPAVGSVEGAR